VLWQYKIKSMTCMSLPVLAWQHEKYVR